MKVAGFVLTGGQSSRMGQDKALLPIGSQTLCEHVGDVVGEVADKVWLVGHPERYQGLKYPCIEDLHPDMGPISGLEAALNLAAAPLCVVVSCDLVNVKAEWLRELVLVAQSSGAFCVVVEDGGGQRQPLCGVYRCECLEVVSRALSEGRLRMMDLLVELGAQTVKTSDTLLNVNTLQEYRAK